MVMAITLIFQTGSVAQANSQYDQLVQIGKSQLQAGNADQALASGEAAVKLDPERWEAHALAGGALMNLKRYEEATDHLSRAIELAPAEKQTGLRNLRKQCVLAEGGVSPAAPAPQPVTVATTQAEIVLWKSIENSSRQSDFDTYLQQYPKGAFVSLAHSHITELASHGVQSVTGPMGKIHGHITNPTGAAEGGGSVSLSVDGGRTSIFTFPVSSNGDYVGDAPPGTYTAIFRQANTPPDRVIDSFAGIGIATGQNVLQDFDMSRQEFVDKLTPGQKKQLEDLRRQNSGAIGVNEIIRGLNADLKVVTQDIKDADSAHTTAVQTLGPTASGAELDAKEAEIKTAKYTEIETLMLKDTGAKPDASILWAQLGQAQVGLKKYDSAETTYKKVLELEAASKRPNPAVQGLANSGLGEIYARTGKIPQANAAYDAAASVNPTQAAFYLKNEAVIFFQMKNGDALVATASEAIRIDPSQALLYYLKGMGLEQMSTLDAKTQKIVLPRGCAEAYQKYLELAPTGPYAAQVKGILAQAE
jgi:tetratricopeptide (TPR) repeat protein